MRVSPPNIMEVFGAPLARREFALATESGKEFR